MEIRDVSNNYKFIIYIIPQQLTWNNVSYYEEWTESFGYNVDEIVSSDIIGMAYGSLFDATLTEVTDLKDGGQLVKTAAWYDNEMSFTAQLIRTLEYFSKIAK